ncbi:hypothetical protein [Aquimarina litoralis]|uniref:hypothetical protein n=1 Tax=Aquimarina litoralis TaxID=584605 RepID=UPI001C57F293|nr:hypothetical protein [Aquimarina litoralis]MBW1298929.1 hypothetical protein [Aquimarina litoralis]
MKLEQQLFHKITHHFEGIQKAEVLLNFNKNHLRQENLEKNISSDVDQKTEAHSFGFTILPNGNFCELEGANDWIHIYKENKRGWNRCNPFTTYYFKTKYAPLELVKLTKKHLLENVYQTAHENDIRMFLMVYNITKKDEISGKMSLLEIE